ncbi:MAG: hypothetical protein A2104_08225 [Candidatus Melainabacteria bacterium GWF2_32_7]|nr:MAG: hypothetical protein A2104_08225 [Candidatus Melainabacteria bacterium GWF2_32_7]
MLNSVGSYNGLENYQKLNILKNKSPQQLSFTGYKEVKSFDVPYNPLPGKEYALHNGQRVIIINKPGPTKLQTFVKAGSVNEEERIRGERHYIEHDQFNGSKNLPAGMFDNLAEGLGAYINAYTAYDKIAFHLQAAIDSEKDLDELIRIHADMIQDPTYPEETHKKEQSVVKAEIHRSKDEIENKAFDLMLNNLIGLKTKSVGIILGEESNIDKISREDEFNYHKTWFRPDNLVTVITGDVDHKEAIELIDKHFGKRKADPTAKDNEYYTPLNLTQKPIVEKLAHPGIESVKQFTGFIGPKNEDIKECIIAEALIQVLTGYKNAKLMKRLEPLGVNPGLGTLSVSSKSTDPKAIYLIADFEPGQEKKGQDIIKSTFEELKQKPLNQKELDIIKNRLKYNIAKNTEIAENITEDIGSVLLENGVINSYANLPKIIDSITPEDIQNVAKKYLDFNKSSTTLVYPKPDQVNEEKQNTQISFSGAKQNNNIAFGSNTKIISPEKIKELDLSNNLHVIINDNPTSVVANAIIGFRTDKLPPNKPGVTETLSELLFRQGTKNYSQKELNDQMDTNNIDITPIISPKGIFLEVESPVENLPKGIELAKEILLNPNISKDNVATSVNYVKNKYLGEEEKAKDKLYETLYGDHPYGYSPRTIKENVDKVTTDDVKAFYDSIIENAQGKCVITAPLSKIEGLEKNALDTLDSGMPELEKYNNKIEDLEPITQQKVVATGVEGKKQAQIMQAFKIPDNIPIEDQAALHVLDKVLGGSMQSRLFQDLREKQMLAYAVNSNYVNNGPKSLFNLFIQASTVDFVDGKEVKKPKNIVKSLDGFNKHLNQMKNEPVTENELKKAKKMLNTNFITNCEPTSGKNVMITKGSNNSYGPTYINNLLESINKVTPDDIKEVAKKYLNSPSVISILGTPDAIKANEEYLKNIGDLKIY